MGMYDWDDAAAPTVTIPSPVTPAVTVPDVATPTASPPVSVAGEPGRWRPEYAPAVTCRRCQRLQNPARPSTARRDWRGQDAFCETFCMPFDNHCKPLLDEIHYCVYSYPMEGAAHV